MKQDDSRNPRYGRSTHEDGNGTQHCKKPYRALPPGTQWRGVDAPDGKAAARRRKQTDAALLRDVKKAQRLLSRDVAFGPVTLFTAAGVHRRLEDGSLVFMTHEDYDAAGLPR